MQKVRALHFYLGVFFAPSIIFFAFSGALQSFGLHEGEGHAKWIEEMGEVHKNQRPPDWMKAAPKAATPQQSAPQQQSTAQPTAGAAAAPANAPSQATAPAASAQPTPAPTQTAPVRRPPRKPKSVPFKVFSAVMATGLILSSILGILIAFRMKPDPKPIWLMLVLGTIVPAVLLYLN